MQQSGICLKLDVGGNIIADSKEIDLFYAYLQSGIKDIPSNLPFLYFTDNNFQACKNRSNDIIYRELPTCCGVVKTSGFYCHKINKFNISPDFCHQCLQYESK